MYGVVYLFVVMVDGKLQESMPIVSGMDLLSAMAMESLTAAESFIATESLAKRCF